MLSEEIQLRAARIGVLAAALPGFLLILAAGLVLDESLPMARMLFGAGGSTVIVTVLLMMRIAAFGTGPFIKMSLQARLAWLAGLSAFVIVDGLLALFLDQFAGGFQSLGFVAIGAGLRQAALIAFLLAVRWFDHYELFSIDESGGRRHV
jgi:hypothetical protein